MTNALLNRRTLLATGGAVIATGASGLLVPASAQGLAPTPSMRGGSNNYRPGAPIVDRIGGGGFWMSGTVRRAGDGAPLAGQRIQIWAHTTEGHERDARAMAQHSPMRTVNSASRCRRLFPLSASRTAILRMTVVSSRPFSCARSCQVRKTPA